MVEGIPEEELNSKEDWEIRYSPSVGSTLINHQIRLSRLILSTSQKKIIFWVPVPPILTSKVCIYLDDVQKLHKSRKDISLDIHSSLPKISKSNVVWSTVCLEFSSIFAKKYEYCNHIEHNTYLLILSTTNILCYKMSWGQKKLSHFILISLY